MKFPEFLKVYGDTSYRGKCPIEDLEQINFFAHLSELWPQYFDVAIHPKNEGQRTWGQVSKDKKMGLNKGASDIIIPAIQPLIIELKRRDHTKSKWSDGQIKYLLAANNLGAFTCVALGYEAALEAVADWHSQKLLIAEKLKE